MTGESGRTLDDVEAYYGISLAGFPNFFSLLGPNPGVGHNSVLLMVEAQVGYVLDLLATIRAAGAEAAAVRPEVQQASNQRLRGRLDMTVWQKGGCTSWYQDEQGRNIALWPASTVEYIVRTRRASMADYDLKFGRSTSAGRCPDRGIQEVGRSARPTDIRRGNRAQPNYD
jgi:hypothetical protein